MEEKVTVAKIINTRGLKGEVKCFILSDFVRQRFSKNTSLFILSDSGEKKELTIRKTNLYKGFIYISFFEIDDINKAVELKNKFIYITKKNLPKLEDSENYYHYQLLDCNVIYKEKIIGKISEIFSNGKQDIVRVVDKNNKAFLIPFIDNFIFMVDVDKKKIKVKDLGELYEN